MPSAFWVVVAEVQLFCHTEAARVAEDVLELIELRLQACILLA